MSFISSPGPGAYETAKKSSAPSYTMRRKTTDFKMYNNPGPGVYDPRAQVVKNKAPAYSMRARTVSNSRDGVPGPGHYSSRSLIGLAHSKSMTARRASNMISFTPGPGAYNPTSKTLPKAPGYSLTGRSGGFGSSFTTPGPGKYESSALFRSGKGFSMSGRFVSKDRGGAPGPGKYNADVSRIKHKAPVFSMRLRNNGGSQYYSSTNKAPGVLTRLDDGSLVR